MESLTAEIEARVWQYIRQVDELGGSTQAIASHFFQNEIRSTAYRAQQEADSGERIVVGVNKFQTEQAVEPALFSVDEAVQQDQVDRFKALKAKRHGHSVNQALAGIRRRALGSENLMPAILIAVEQRATLGEIAHTLRGVWGEYRE